MRKLLGTLFWLFALATIGFVAHKLPNGEQARFWLMFPAVACVCGLIGVWVHEGRPRG